MRKRKVDPTSYIDVKAKKARNSGEAGVGRKGIPIAARVIGESCGNKCRWKCQKKYSYEDRKYAHDLFYNTSSKREKWQCIYNWLEDNEMALNDSDGSSSESKSESNQKSYGTFRLPRKTDGVLITVCKTMFLHTLGKKPRFF